MKATKVLYMIAAILVIIGGLNWGLVGFFDYNLVDSLFGAGSVLSKVIYDLVGLSALALIVLMPMKMRMKKDMSMGGSDNMNEMEKS